MLELRQVDRVCEIRLARAPVNALDRALIEALDAALERQFAAPECGAIVLAGAPGIFSAGLDVREVTGERPVVESLVRGFWRLQERLVRSPKPVVAAITGHCPAGGMVIAMLCDHRIMAQGEFRIGLNEVQVGLYPGDTVYRAFERLVGAARAASMLPRGLMLASAGASSSTSPAASAAAEAVIERAHAHARELLRLPEQAYARTRALTRGDLVALYAAPRESLDTLLADGWASEETRAAMRQLLAARAT